MKTKKTNMNRTNFEYIGEKWIIARTNHLYDVRDSAKGDYSRDEFLDNQRYIDIFKCAIRNGLTSFRCKGFNIVVTIHTLMIMFFMLFYVDLKNITR